MSFFDAESEENSTGRIEGYMLVEITRIKKEEVTIVTSLDIAETFGKEHRRVLQDIRELQCSEEFRQHNFVQSSYINAQNKTQPMYLITRDGFMLLVMGYTGEKAMRFKEAYIKQFHAMEKALFDKIKEREKGIAVRQALTKALQQSNENERMHGHAYSIYTNLIYNSIFGKDAKHLREEYGISQKDELRDCFSSEELQQVQKAEMLVSSLVEYGWGYDGIKDFILNKLADRIVA